MGLVWDWGSLWWPLSPLTRRLLLEKDVGVGGFTVTPSPPTPGERARGGWEEMFCFPHLFPDPLLTSVKLGGVGLQIGGGLEGKGPGYRISRGGSWYLLPLTPAPLSSHRSAGPVGFRGHLQTGHGTASVQHIDRLPKLL